MGSAPCRLRVFFSPFGVGISGHWARPREYVRTYMHTLLHVVRVRWFGTYRLAGSLGLCVCAWTTTQSKTCTMILYCIVDLHRQTQRNHGINARNRVSFLVLYPCPEHHACEIAHFTSHAYCPTCSAPGCSKTKKQFQCQRALQAQDSPAYNDLSRQILKWCRGSACAQTPCAA